MMNRLRPSLRALTALLGVLGLLLVPGRGPAADGPSLEYQVKAAFLVKLAQFVDWPAHTFPSPETPICIGILGTDPFGAQFDEAVARERVNGRPMRVRRVREITELGGCHIVFLGASEMARLPELTAQLGASPVLTVGEHPTFARAGGIVNFTKEDGRVRFEVNRTAGTKAGLHLSAKFLQVARVLEPDREIGRAGE